MNRFSLFSISVVLLSWNLCWAASPAAVDNVQCNESTFSQYSKDADEALKKAKDVGHEWSETAALIQSAKQLAADKHFEEACKSAHAGLLQSRMAYRQWEENKNAGPRF